MACELCARNYHCCRVLNHVTNYDTPHYSDVPAEPADDEEPVAPTLSLGNRILWLTETRAASGIVRWIGRIPSISFEWTAGIEFDNVMPDGGNGDFGGRTYFQSRPGHAVFLPVSDVLNVDENTSNATRNGERSFFGRLQESCSNIAHRRRRDATFGHFKHEYCSNCSRNEFPYNSHYCNRAPVYDRITSRKSLCYDDHPYEAYNPHVSVNAVSNSNNELWKSNVCQMQAHMAHQELHLENASNASTLRRRDKNGFRDDGFNRINAFQKESIFNPRASLRLISGFKEWVSCLVTGTNRRKSKNEIVFKDRRSVTSVFLAQNSQSVTGQRLSSFSEYSSVNMSRRPKQDSTIPKNSLKQADKEIENHDQPARSKYRRRNKRPAPVPPIQYPTTNNLKGCQSVASVNPSDKIVHETVKKGEVSKQKDQRHVGYKLVRSSSIHSHSVSVRRSRKKRKAPSPPVLKNDHNLTSEKNQSVEKLITDLSYGQPEKMNDKFVSERHLVSMPKSKLKRSKLKILNHHLKNPKFTRSIEFIDGSRDSGSDDGKNSCDSISFSEDESDVEKYGLVKYGVIKRKNSLERDNHPPSTSTFLPFSNDESDICLKISIQKTETNVVTVEEVASPHTVHYTIEEDSSSTYMSDEADNVDDEKTSAVNSPEIKLHSTDSSTDEIGEKSKTIFEDLQIKPPVKGSVKDFVNAFNMLANKSSSESPMKKQNPPAITEQTQNAANSSGIKNSESALSHPTKWEYQTNKSNGFLVNQYLLPIEEESHNETSEHDGNADESKNVQQMPVKLKKPSLQITQNSKASKLSEINDNSSAECSHCSEKHIHSSSRSIKCNAESKKKCSHDSYKSKKNTYSTQASMAALCSLLKEKTSPGEVKNRTQASDLEKLNAKLDQPIMVGLYIEDKSSHRGPIPLLVTPSMSLKRLKKQMEKEYEIPRHQQCWILGESFAVAEEDSLASYGVTDPGCPILLYAMAKDSKSSSLPTRSSHHRSKIVEQSSDSSNEEDQATPRRTKKGHLKLKSVSQTENSLRQSNLECGSKVHNKLTHHRSRKVSPRSSLPKSSLQKHTDSSGSSNRKNKSDYHKAWEVEYEKKSDYRTLVALDDVDLVTNTEPLECPICFLDIGPGEGATLMDCLHNFCRECLASSIQYSDTALIRCPFRNDEYSCESHLQEREIKSLVSKEIYERHLQKSMALAESQAQDSFHCKTPDCPGWCLFEDNVNTFKCPVCKHTNCLTCAAVHEGKNCRQYQDDVAIRCDSSEEARKTKEYLQNMVENGEAMECPQCQVILMKKWGCDWLKCSMCHTEVCWVTKGPRWGPAGRGDTSGGCKCMLNGVRCHPKCSYCH